MDCQHPRCSDGASDTYRGKHDNALRLCERHYYQLVSGKSVSSPSVFGATEDTDFGVASTTTAANEAIGAARREAHLASDEDKFTTEPPKLSDLAVDQPSRIRNRHNRGEHR